MLLWNDSFNYANTTALAHYWTYNGSPELRATGRLQTSYSIGLSNGEWIQTKTNLQTGTTGGKDYAIIGFSAKVPECNDQSRFMDLFSSAGASVVWVIYRKIDSSKFYLEVWRKVSGDDAVLYRTNTYDHGVWHFFELQVIFASSQGSMKWRTGGYLEGSSEPVKTDSSPLRGWAKIRFWNQSVGNTTYFSDLYLCNAENAQTEPRFARFLGEVSTATLHPDPERANKGSKMEWQDSASPLPFRLIILAGQSNMDGYTLAPNPPPSSRSPNNNIWIWDRVSRSPAEPYPIEAGVNSAGLMKATSPGSVSYHGPEMRFAERLAAYYEQTPSNAGTPVVNTIIIKAAKGGTWMSGVVADPRLSWFPALNNNLYDGPATPNLKNDLELCIQWINTNYGAGWPNIEKVDFFWLQGENDAQAFPPGFGLPVSYWADNYTNNLFSLFSQLDADFPQLQTKGTYHIVQIHKDLNSGVFPYKNTVRFVHQYFAQYFDRYRLIKLDDVPIGVDETHFDAAGYAMIGDLMFESWLQEQPYASQVDDFADGAEDDRGLVVNLENKDATLLWSGAKHTVNTEVLAVRMDAHGMALVGGPAEVKVLESDGFFYGATGGAMTFSISPGNMDNLIMLSSPLTGRVILEDQLQGNEWGFRSS